MTKKRGLPASLFVCLLVSLGVLDAAQLDVVIALLEGDGAVLESIAFLVEFKGDLHGAVVVFGDLISTGGSDGLDLTQEGDLVFGLDLVALEGVADLPALAQHFQLTGVGAGGNLGAAAGGAGEIGHIICVDEADVVGRCNCGHKGCLEQIASATGIVNYAKRYLEHAPEVSILANRLRDVGDITAKDVLDAAKEGDRAAVRITDKVFMYLGKALAGICNVINPECVLIGGGVSAAGEYLRAGVEQYFKVFAFAGIEDTPIRLATIGNQAGIAGAAYMIISDK